MKAQNDVLLKLAVKVELLLADIRREEKCPPGWMYTGDVLKNVGEDSRFLGSWKLVEAFQISRFVMSGDDFTERLIRKVALATMAGQEKQKVFKEFVSKVTPYVGKFLEENRELVAECVLAGLGSEKRKTP